jgi:FkbM family methyltransferase
MTIEAPAGGVIARAWHAGHWYEAPLLEHIRTLGVDGLAVDAGANIGNHTLWFARACSLTVAAFEPLHHALLRGNVHRNGLDAQVNVYPFALGASATTALHLGKGALRTGSGAIPVRTLDSCELTGVALVKADVEGMEPQALAGGEQTIRRDRPVIFAEVWPGHEAALAAVLTPWGYRKVRRFYGRGGTPTPVEEWRHE